MPSVVKLTEPLFPEVCGELLSELDPTVSEADWRRTFLACPRSGEDYFGQVLVDGAKPVGVLGMLFSEREIDGVRRKFCNLHAWYVKPEYRAMSLLLMRRALALKEHTLTDLSPSDGVAEINRRLGFTKLDDSALLLYPLPWNGGGAIEAVAFDPREEAADGWLTKSERRLLDDHQASGCGHVLFRGDGERCLVIFSQVDGPRFSYCDVHYVSDRAVFARHHAFVRAALGRLSGRRAVVVDSRLASGVRIPCSLRLAAREKMFRPVGVAAEQVDNLYSELMSLKLSTLPGIRAQLRHWARRFWDWTRSSMVPRGCRVRRCGRSGFDAPLGA